MKNRYILFIVGILFLSFYSCGKPQSNQVKEYPMFWTWIGYNPQSNFDSICRSLSELGLDGIVLKANSAEQYRQCYNRHGSRLTIPDVRLLSWHC